jgi:hypothetical protein
MHGGYNYDGLINLTLVCRTKPESTTRVQYGDSAVQTFSCMQIGPQLE